MSISAYKSVGLHSDINSASPHRLIQMLYEGAISSINQAIGAIDRKRYDEKSSLISKSIAILVELEASLNADRGGEIADNLAKLYSYMRESLLYASGANDTDKLSEVSSMLMELKEAWDEVPVELRYTSGGRVTPEVPKESEDEEL